MIRLREDMFYLPVDILRHIYSYDSTYREMFDECIHELEVRIECYWFLRLTRMLEEENLFDTLLWNEQVEDFEPEDFVED